MSAVIGDMGDRTGTWRRLAWVATAASLMLTGCSAPEDEGVAKAEPGPIPPAQQREGDPAKGYEVVVQGRYVTCGLPYPAWKRATGGGEAAGPRLPGRTGVNAELPYYLSVHENAQGVEIVTANCLLCHGGMANGELIVGLGNAALDLTEAPGRLAEAVGSYVTGPEATATWSKWASRIETIAPYMVTDTIGVNSAPNLTLALMAHRDPETLAWSEEPRIEPPSQRPLPVSVPPWWRMGKKHAMFYNGMGRGDHARFMMMKSLVCTDSVAGARAIDTMFADVRAYIASLEPPAYPFAIDGDLAEEGKGVFEASCARCHGSYGSSASYPNLVVALETVGTDPEYALQAYEDSDRFTRWLNRSWYGDIARARPARGYVAPPLDGIWATAPFLHNGSVPTLEGLLDSRKRPTYWLRDSEPAELDPAAVGWRYETVSHGKEGAADPALRKRIYDTTQRGYANTGHTFGDALSGEARTALLEYLKTL